MKRTRYRYINLTDKEYRELHCYGWSPYIYFSKEEALSRLDEGETTYRLVKVRK